MLYNANSNEASTDHVNVVAEASNEGTGKYDDIPIATAAVVVEPSTPVVVQQPVQATPQAAAHFSHQPIPPRQPTMFTLARKKSVKMIKDRKSKATKVCACFATFCCMIIVMVVGLPMYIVSRDSTAVLLRFPPEEIFDERSCEITNYDVRSESISECCSSDKGRCQRYCDECRDHFTYAFKQTSPAVNDESRGIWQSAEWTKIRDDDKKCDRTSKPLSTPHFVEGSKVGCWWFKDVFPLHYNDGCLRLKDEGTGACVPGYPSCGNSECFVLRDPIKMGEERLVFNGGLFIAGIVFLGFIGMVCLCGTCITFCCLGL